MPGRPTYMHDMIKYEDIRFEWSLWNAYPDQKCVRIWYVDSRGIPRQSRRYYVDDVWTLSLVFSAYRRTISRYVL